jgi:hypothetical protein
MLLRLLVAGILLAVAFLALSTGAFSDLIKVTPPLQDAAPLQAAIEALQPGDTVVVAVEFGTAEAGEMNHVATALLAHLRDRQVRVIAASTLPEGPGLIHYQASRLQTPDLILDEAGYLPAADSGVAQFLARDDVQQAKLVLVLAARPERLRWWLEQNAAAPRSLPLGVGMNAATGPLMIPYLKTAGVQGWISGLAGVMAYSTERGIPLAQGETATGRLLQALTLTQWVAAGLLLVGALYYLPKRKKRTA